MPDCENPTEREPLTKVRKKNKQKEQNMHTSLP